MSVPSIFEYLPLEYARALVKLAEEGESSTSRVLRPIVAGAAGLGVGTLAGMGAGHLANSAYKHFSGKNIPSSHLMRAVPALGAGLGLAYSMAQAHQMEAVRDALKNTDHKP